MVVGQQPPLLSYFGVSLFAASYSKPATRFYLSCSKLQQAYDTLLSLLKQARL
jgi:hypothetical protein